MNKPKRKNSRAKGSRGERQVAKLFSDWWGSEFTRTPLSGGFATQKFREDWNAAGDLVTPDPAFPFCVECKWVEGVSLDQLLPNNGCLIYKWYQQACDECPDGKLPLLVFKKNGQPFYCMLKEDFLYSVVDLDATRFGSGYLTLHKPGKPVLAILLLGDLFMYTEKDTWIAQRNDLLLKK